MDRQQHQERVAWSSPPSAATVQHGYARASREVLLAVLERLGDPALVGAPDARAHQPVAAR